MKKLLFKWGEIKATFWFIPAIIIVASILLSLGLVYIDTHINISKDGMLRFFFVSSSDSARSILSTISGAMMGVAGTVFSITLVALTLASSQFGPRLVKNFMYVRLNQVVLGAYISTYLYCLLVLNAVKDDGGYTFIPSLSILVAIFAAIANIVLLIVFIHHIAISLQADKVISDISDFLSKQVAALFPENLDNDSTTEENVDVDSIISGYQDKKSIRCRKSGYLQYVDDEALIKLMSEKDSILQLDYRPGGYLVKGEKIGMIYSKGNWKKEELENIFTHFVIGKTKTSRQDLEFSIHQMVEIASRALSPGINDPFTAIACVDNLSATLSYLAKAKFPSKYVFDEKDNLRIIADTFDFEGLLDAAFNQIRQFSGGIPSVIIRLMEALITIDGFASDEQRKKALIRHAEMVLNTGKETIKEKNDLEDLTNRAKKILN